MTAPTQVRERPPVTPLTRPCRCCGGVGVEPDPVAIGRIIGAARKRKGLSLREVGERAGCSHVYVADLEAGRRPQTGTKARAVQGLGSRAVTPMDSGERAGLCVGSLAPRGWTYGEPDLFGYRPIVGFGDNVVTVAVIAKAVADRVIRDGHYSGSVAWSSNEHFGVFVRGEMVGAMQFGPGMNPASGAGVVAGTRPDQWAELNRLWIADGQPGNTTSRAVAYGLRLLRQRRPAIAWVQSFADERCGKAGGIYQACSFLYLGCHETTFYELDGEWFHKSMVGRAEYDARGWWCGPKIARLNANLDRATPHSFRQYRYLKPLAPWVRRAVLVEPQAYPKPDAPSVARAVVAALRGAP